MQGIHLENPACDCAEMLLSRVPLTGKGDGQAVPRSLFFRCAVGRCRIFTHAVDEQPIPSGKIRADLGENKSGSKSESESQDGSDQNEWEEILEQYDAAFQTLDTLIHCN